MKREIRGRRVFFGRVTAKFQLGAKRLEASNKENKKTRLKGRGWGQCLEKIISLWRCIIHYDHQQAGGVGEELKLWPFEKVSKVKVGLYRLREKKNKRYHQMEMFKSGKVENRDGGRGTFLKLYF